ncbi:MAG: DUF1428 domain-containing protein [Micropepsaceae bacterium]
MPNYVDGFVIPVPNAKKEAYRRLAEKAAPIFREYGALSVVECWGDDVPPGVLTSFPMAVKCNADETVVFSWIVWPSREARDAGNKKAMEDPRMELEGDMPFDGKRMIIGGFRVMVEG